MCEKMCMYEYLYMYEKMCMCEYLYMYACMENVMNTILVKLFVFIRCIRDTLLYSIYIITLGNLI